MFVFNASPLILIFEEIDEPGLLTLFKKIDSDLVITKDVFDELNSNNCRNYLMKYLSDKTLVLIENNNLDDLKYLKNRYPQLHSGEISVMSLVREDSKDPLFDLLNNDNSNKSKKNSDEQKYQENFHLEGNEDLASLRFDIPVPQGFIQKNGMLSIDLIG